MLDPPRFDSLGALSCVASVEREKRGKGGYFVGKQQGIQAFKRYVAVECEYVAQTILSCKRK
jgi:hypothetical protein